MLPENEPCPNSPDFYNSGCGSDNLAHTLPIHCGEWYCGTSEANGFTVDRDVYEITLTGYDSLVWCTFANFGIYASITQPFSGCGPSILWASASQGRCDTLCLGVCLPPGTYWLTLQPYGNVNCLLDQYVTGVQCVPCSSCVECPPGAFVENEPCPSQGDIYNGGCTYPPYATMPVSCGMDICGTSYMQDFGDNDFYEIVLTQPDSLIWCVTAEFPVAISIHTPATFCPSMLTWASGTAPACSTLCVSACLNPGVYWLRVAANGPTGFVCKPYIAHVDCIPCLGVPVDSCQYPSLDLEPLNNSCAAGLPGFGCPDTLCGRITTGAGAPDHDWYELNIPGPNCQQMFISCYGNDTPGWYSYSQGLDPRLSLWASDCLTLLNYDDSTGTGDDPILFTPCLQPGVYYLRVQGAAFTTGPYVLTMRCLDCVCPCQLGCGHWPLDGELCPTLPGPDLYNGGCNSDSTTPPLVSITCGQTFCAQSFAMGGTVDHDWYQLTLTANRRIYWFVTGEFPFQAQIYRPTPDCSNLTLLRNVTGNPCQTKLSFIKCLAPGTYWFHVAPTVTTAVPCSEYISRLLCGHCFLIHVVVGPISLTSADLRISWEPDETQPQFNVYRSPNYDFEPSPDLLVGSTTDTTFIDTGALSRPDPVMFYIVTMEDPPEEQP